MSITQFPAYLRLASSADEVTPVRLRAAVPIPIAERAPRILTESQLSQRLALVGELAPHAPLSFVAVEVLGFDASNSQPQLEEIAGTLARLTRATDAVGRLGETGFGIVLQGAGATAAAAVAARLCFHTNRLVGVVSRCTIRTSAASGTGENADVLIAAALDSLQECS